MIANGQTLFLEALLEQIDEGIDTIRAPSGNTRDRFGKLFKRTYNQTFYRLQFHPARDDSYAEPCSNRHCNSPCMAYALGDLRGKANSASAVSMRAAKSSKERSLWFAAVSITPIRLPSSEKGSDRLHPFMTFATVGFRRTKRFKRLYASSSSITDIFGGSIGTVGINRMRLSNSASNAGIKQLAIGYGGGLIGARHAGRHTRIKLIFAQSEGFIVNRPAFDSRKLPHGEIFHPVQG